MIDTADKQTAALPLEQPKRGRGRPSTGAAMTAAEKQRAYRKRLAEQRANQVPADWHQKMKSAADERIEQLEQQLANAIARAKLAEATIEEMKKGNVTELETEGMWTVQRREAGKKTWTSSEPETFRSAKDSVDYMQFKSGSGQGNTWRAVRADGMMYWPKAQK